MNPSDKLDTKETQEVKTVFEKITPAILEMLQRKDSGEITIFFHEGQFKRAKKTVTV
jgi:hypothetical protein